ncbi:hypothetical protein HYH03_013126 [Edaphochlamys debaryana]|uniref:Uncharacterized protein n=1 Tax=Edaphochlamys debaryana TaxID=47281 RepID=A0A836BT80_9CHLO|nr:hypothetical protein HYH03_013126 [Edaphochlamys debaryana]|eukprot:KAG2488276.1 hypothetical protein HYH03_013126 [Edaphochlamys debaryana]
MAALLRRVRVAQLHDPAFDPAAAQKLLDAVEARLRTITLRFGKLRDITAYLHALAKLRSPPPPPARSSSSSSPSSPGAPLAPLVQPHELALDLAAFATRSRVELITASPKRLSTLLWALLRLLPAESHGSEKLQVVLDRLALVSLRQLGNYTPQDLRNLALAYATFGPRPDGPARAASASGAAPVPTPAGTAEGEQALDWPALAKRSAPAPTPDAREAAAAKRRTRNARMLQALTAELAARSGNLAVPQPEPRDLALAAHALSLAGLTAAASPNTLALLSKAAAAAAEALAPGRAGPLADAEVAGLLEALAEAGVRHGPLLEATRTWAGAAGEALAPEVRARLAGAFNRLGSEL